MGGTVVTSPFQPLGGFNLGTGASSLMGQGTKPELWAVHSVSDAATDPPEWTDITTDVRSFSTSRGRDSELSEFDSGTAQVVLNNRARAYDPTVQSAIRPMNRVRLYERFNALTNVVYTGYVESYDQQWPGPGMSDAICVANLADEFKPLARVALPTTDPPRDNYKDVVLYDTPSGYWRMDDDVSTMQVQAEVGEPLTTFGTGSSRGTPGAVVGEDGAYWQSVNNDANDAGLSEPVSGDFGGLAEFALELWANFTTIGTYENLAHTSNSSGNVQINLTAAGNFEVKVDNTTPTTFTVTESAVRLVNTWYHVVGTITGGSLRLYVNGAQVGSTGFTPPIRDGATPLFSLEGVATNTHRFDEVACYRHGLSAARVLAHYQAGAERGFASQEADVRFGAVLDSVSSHAPRYVFPKAGSRTMPPVFQHGQSALDELRNARNADNVDAALFVARDGTLTFLTYQHRANSPYNATQMTFGDEGHTDEWPYVNLDTDYSDSYITNYWTVTREAGLTQTEQDAISIAKYGKRAQALTIPVTTDIAAGAIAVLMLAKYKNPLMRVLTIELDCADVNVLNEVFQRDLCDRIRVIRTLPPGGAWFDQTLYIQKIEVEGSNSQESWKVRLGVSPV